MKGKSILKTGVLALCLTSLLFLAGCPWYDDDHHGRRHHYEDHDDDDDDRYERRERHDRR